MARPPKFSSEEILDAASALVAEGGPARATIGAIAERIAAPSGSIYHRFASRDLLLAQLWVRTARRAQGGFVAALAHEDLQRAALDAALHIPAWSRRHPDDARTMLLYRPQELARQWPDELGDQLEALRGGVDDALRAFTRRLWGRSSTSARRTTDFALLDVPYAAVRRYLLAGKPPPAHVDDLVIQTCQTVLPLPPPKHRGCVD